MNLTLEIHPENSMHGKIILQLNTSDFSFELFRDGEFLDRLDVSEEDINHLGYENAVRQVADEYLEILLTREVEDLLLSLG